MNALPDGPSEILEFLRTIGSARFIQVNKSESIYLQGGDSDSVYYIASGKVRLSVASRTGKEATIALLSKADFFGEDTMQSGGLHAESATAWNDVGMLKIDKLLMVSALKIAGSPRGPDSSVASITSGMYGGLSILT
jgi:CRP/FNR family cyclic AMP-dependent transcriptional regulator